jgi:hypothetical protein
MIRKITVYLTLHDSYGEDELSKKKRRDYLYGCLEDVAKYSPLTDWCELNQSEFEKLTFATLKEKIISRFLVSSKMTDKKGKGQKRSRGDDSEDEAPSAVGQKGDIPRGSAVTVAQFVSSKTPLEQISKSQTKEMKKIIKPLFEAEFNAARAAKPPGAASNSRPNANGGGKGGGKGGNGGGGKGKGYQADPNRWCHHCNIDGHWTNQCWYPPSGYNAKGGKGGKGGGKSSHWSSFD